MGASHTRSGTNYTGTCTICDKWYREEAGFNAHARIDTLDTNPIVRHLEEEHPARRQDLTTFTFTAIRLMAPGNLLNGDAMRGD